MTAPIINRYSETDLAEFKFAIGKKLDKAERQLASLDMQIEEATEQRGDLMDSSSNSNDMEMLQMMVNRQRKHILDLTNALQRVYNNSYGICVVTGELIDKRRLLAVPTTTKNLVGKLAMI